MLGPGTCVECKPHLRAPTGLLGFVPSKLVYPSRPIEAASALWEKGKKFPLALLWLNNNPNIQPAFHCIASQDCAVCGGQGKYSRQYTKTNEIYVLNLYTVIDAGHVFMSHLDYLGVFHMKHGGPKQSLAPMAFSPDLNHQTPLLSLNYHQSRSPLRSLNCL